MIKLENFEVTGWEPAIRGMRNPMNSWDKSDSGYGCDIYGNRVYCRNCNVVDKGSCKEYRTLSIGPNDIELLKKLANAGTDHRKFMRMIVVYTDITAPLYWWKEFDTYKVGTVANSCSTMHKIAEKEFTLADFSCEHLISGSMVLINEIIDDLNDCREWYLKYDSMREEDKIHFDQNITCKKDIWWQMIQLLPSSYNQKRTVMLNYEVLTNIYESRKNHKLDEWNEFCKWIERLPYSEIITGNDKEINND